VTERGLKDWVTLRGPQPHEVVCTAYERASIFVLPSVVAGDGDRDGLPVVLLEAMASGLPVISTSVVGIRELIDPDRDGLIVPPHDAPALASALERLLVDPQLRDCLARAARAKIEARFSIDRSADRLLAVWDPSPRGAALCLRS